jgi:hypothetical protein
VRVHFRRRRERAPVTSGDTGVVLGLGFDLRFDRVGHRVRLQVEDQRSGFPALGRYVQTHLIHAPAALIEDPLGGSYSE